MPYALLKREPVANAAPATGYSVYSYFYDTAARRVFPDTVQSTTNTGAAAAFELTVDALVPGASFCRGTTRREVRYAGGGQIYTQDVAGSILCAPTLTSLTVTGTGTDQVNAPTGSIAVAWTGTAAPWLVRCGLVQAFVPGTSPYFEEYTAYAGPLTFPLLATQRSADPNTYCTPPLPPGLGSPAPAGGLPPGRYRVDVTDANGHTLGQDVVVGAEKPADGHIVLYWDGNPAGGGTSYNIPMGPMRLIYSADATYLYQVDLVANTDRVFLGCKIQNNVVFASFYRLNSGAAFGGNAVSVGVVTAATGGDLFAKALDGFRMFRPAGDVVDYVANAVICSDGQGGVYRRALGLAPRPLRLENVIYFHPDTPAEANAGLLVEVSEQADPDCPALAFALYNAFNALVETNATGRFGGLVAGQYRVRVSCPTDARLLPLSVDATLRNRYGKWRTLAFDDLENHVACRVELWLRDYDDAPAALCGTGEPVVLATEGVESGPLQADLPDAVGSSLTLNLITEPEELQDLVLEDRVCRADFYYGNTLKFRGYVQPETFTAPLLSGQQAVTLIATCGLAALKDTDFAGHVGQELRGRRPLLHTLLHCLSRCDVALPLRFYTNRQAEEMTTGEALELAGYTDRLAYVDDKGKALDCRTVVDACCQALGGTLAQRDGQWQLRTPLEAAAPTPGRSYNAAGVYQGTAPTTPAPAAAVRPPQVATAAAYDWLWLNASQQRHRRAGWKSFSAEADATFAKQAFRQGDYFNESFVWTPGGSALQPVAGWVAGATAGAAAFPLALAQAAGKAGELAAAWPRPAPGTTPGIYFPNAVPGTASAYLESEPAPLRAGRDGLAMQLTLKARFAATDPNFSGDRATVLVEVVWEDAGRALDSQGTVFTVPIETGDTREMGTFTAVVSIGLPCQAIRPRLRLHPYQVARARTLINQTGLFQPAPGGAFLLVESLAVELLPQHAEWEGAQTFTALGPGGTVRPQEPLAVFHCDVPAAAGLFEGNVFAFRRAISRGVSGPTTAWARPADLRPAPLLASAVLDVLALRGNPSQLLTGTVRHRQTTGAAAHNPEFGDAMDAPHDVNGRRWFVASRTWHVKAAETDITALEIGPGEYITPPVYALPDGVLLTEFGSSSYGGESFPDYFTTEAGEPLVIE